MRSIQEITSTGDAFVVVGGLVRVRVNELYANSDLWLQLGQIALSKANFGLLIDIVD